MISTETISAPDYLFFRIVRQHFFKKRQPIFRKKLFQHLTGDLMPFPLPEKTLFSNDTRGRSCPTRAPVCPETEA